MRYISIHFIITKGRRNQYCFQQKVATIVYGKSFNQLTIKGKHIVRIFFEIVNLNLGFVQVTVSLTEKDDTIHIVLSKIFRSVNIITTKVRERSYKIGLFTSRMTLKDDKIFQCKGNWLTVSSIFLCFRCEQN